MSTVGQLEARTQEHVVEIFRDELGFEHLGNWEYRPDNRNVEEELLRAWLARQGHSERAIQKTLWELQQAAAVGGARGLYDANRDVYELLRFGVRVQPDIDQPHVTVPLIDWDQPDSNHFAFAEEVTVSGPNTKRPDVVLYVNGIAVAVLELKRSTISVAEGIRQQLQNQRPEFIQSFFATAQLLLAGNETEGVRYGVIETPEQYWLKWREGPEGIGAEIDSPLDRGLTQLLEPGRFLEILRDFIVFDAGTKKVARHNQFFAVQAARKFIRDRRDGIIWHTQGSGKSLIMVWLARWIHENVADSRVLIITDRIELDEQIEKTFKGVNEDIYRTSSGEDLIDVLNGHEEWLMGSLIHKFGRSDEGDVERYLADIEEHLPRDFEVKGNLFIFVDECHRTQSGKLHKAMKTILPGATMIGFTGTPLLRADKENRSTVVFGPYIHTYKYDEAVEDGVVLDLRYEARDIDQSISSPEKLDQLFKSKTKGLTDRGRAALKRRWGTLQKLYSSRDRLTKIVADIAYDMSTRPRLVSGGHGNAILVSDSIYAACRLYEMFQKTDLAGKCAVVTSYRPSDTDVRGEIAGAGDTEQVEKYKVYRRMLADYFGQAEEEAMSRAEEFETDVKERFINEPGQMKLLIVVDKLLTGFDAPPATYLYIDKRMQNHGLFQAVCRVNRLHTDDKEYGYIVDYMDLFRSLEQSILDYTGGAFEGFDAEDVRGLLKSRLADAKKHLDELLEIVRALCEPVKPPRETVDYIRYFCGSTDPTGDELEETVRRRDVLYKKVTSLVRAYAEIANEMEEAGYSPEAAAKIKQEVQYYEKVREEVRVASGDNLDLKAYDPAMRQLLDTYVRAEDSEVLAGFEDLSLVDLIAEHGEKALQSLPKDIQNSKEAAAETIENNVRKVIVDERPVNPRYYEKMSKLLEALIEQRKNDKISYKEYLAKIEQLARQVATPGSGSEYPEEVQTEAQRSLFDNMGEKADLALAIDEAIQHAKRDGWRNNRLKEREVRAAIATALAPYDDVDADEIFELVRNQREY